MRAPSHRLQRSPPARPRSATHILRKAQAMDVPPQRRAEKSGRLRRITAKGESECDAQIDQNRLKRANHAVSLGQSPWRPLLYGLAHVSVLALCPPGH